MRFRRRRRRPQAITYVTRKHCLLCSEQRPAVAAEAHRAGLVLSVLDVDDDPALHERFTDKVPVVLLDGVEHAFGHLDLRALRRALRGSAAGPRSPL